MSLAFAGLATGCGQERTLQLEGFATSPHWQEQIRDLTYEPPVRVQINAPSAGDFDPRRPTQIILYALPNGNTIEWTVGRAKADGLDWHYDIQHIGAQTRRLREVVKDCNLVVVYLEAERRSWPLWRQKHEGSDRLIADMVTWIKEQIGVANPRVVLSSHSGGGSFMFGYINAFEAIPDEVKRISFLDSNYGFSVDAHHGTKLLEWLRAAPDHYLTVLAYDDREITFKGKKVVGPTGGTYRATHRMIKRLEGEVELAKTTVGDYVRYKGMNGRIDVIVHDNPRNKILHTVLVGDMNGFIHSMTTGTRYEGKAAVFAGPVAYEKWIQPD